MKKTLVVGLIACTMVIGAFAVNADSTDINELPTERGYSNMMEGNYKSNIKVNSNNQETQELRNERQEEKVKDTFEENTITQEQANEHRTYNKDMDKFHEERGFNDEHCHDGITGRRHGHGMMGGNRY